MYRNSYHICITNDSQIKQEMYIPPKKTRQTVKEHPCLVWVEDYRELNPPDRLEFLERFLMQEFGLRKKKYSRSSFLQWVGNNPISAPPFNVAQWCVTELYKVHQQIEALSKGVIINQEAQ